MLLTCVSSLARVVNRMSQFLDTLDAGCATFDAFSRAGGSPPLALQARLNCGDPERAKIQQSIAFMIEHLTERMQVRRLAASINVSPSYFFALFKRQTGYAPIDFLIHLRMRRACSLLQRTDLSVKEIADALGYDDAFYFSRLFKSVTSMAPTDFRMLPAHARENIADEVLPEGLLDVAAPARNRGAPLALGSKPAIRRA